MCIFLGHLLKFIPTQERNLQVLNQHIIKIKISLIITLKSWQLFNNQLISPFYWRYRYHFIIFTNSFLIHLDYKHLIIFTVSFTRFSNTSLVSIFLKIIPSYFVKWDFSIDDRITFTKEFRHGFSYFFGCGFFLMYCLGKSLIYWSFFQENLYSNSNAIYSLGYALMIYLKTWGSLFRYK